MTGMVRIRCAPRSKVVYRHAASPPNSDVIRDALHKVLQDIQAMQVKIIRLGKFANELRISPVSILANRGVRKPVT
jgi:hypothetical protein